MRRVAGALLAAAAALHAAPAFAQSNGTTVNAVARASVLKPLTLTGQQNLNLGTFLLGRGAFSSATVSVSRTGTRTCPAVLTCSGVVTVARYQLTGSNNQTIAISAPPVVLTNTANAAQRLTLTLDAPASIVLPNSGNQGVQFSVGGNLTLSSATPEGTYAGTLEITVNYN